METRGGHGLVAALVTAGVFAALAATLLVGTAPNLNTQFVALGERFWPGYAADLRQDPDPPTCDREDLQARLATCPDDAAAPPTGAADDPFGGKDPFAEDADAPADDPFGGKDPFAEDAPPTGAATDDPFGGKDPFAEDAPPTGAADDPFGGKDPFAAGGAAPAGDDPFGGEDPFAAPSKPKEN